MKRFRKILKLLLVLGCAALIYAHRRVIRAWWTGEPMPEPSEFAKKWCPPLRKCAK